MPDMMKDGTQAASTTVKTPKKKGRKSQKQNMVEMKAQEAASEGAQPGQGQGVADESRDSSPVPGHPLEPQPPQEEGSGEDMGEQHDSDAAADDKSDQMSEVSSAELQADGEGPGTVQRAQGHVVLTPGQLQDIMDH